MRRPIYTLQFLFVAVLTVAILLQGLTGIAKHLPQFEPELAAQIHDHGHAHDPVSDILWSAHGHSHDVADHDHNPVLAILSDMPAPFSPRVKETLMTPSLVAWNMRPSLERPPRV
ncbi:hypothetical protein J7426_16480 [Tropicibacter sp. R16_0]|uniref:hypothetical protein n=1 Tax=Tropicibacter sp. R16_0 TaxID=2821102 RepID=UPI001ADA4D6D|nr:hypothetical protein [Tropicibacter sp. R16_0]MBO9451873.1 hypothetical protein [Tropicibacter sp. R16_0]